MSKVQQHPRMGVSERVIHDVARVRMAAAEQELKESVSAGEVSSRKVADLSREVSKWEALDNKASTAAREGRLGASWLRVTADDLSHSSKYSRGGDADRAVRYNRLEAVKEILETRPAIRD